MKCKFTVYSIAVAGFVSGALLGMAPGWTAKESLLQYYLLDLTETYEYTAVQKHLKKLKKNYTVENLQEAKKDFIPLHNKVKKQSEKEKINESANLRINIMHWNPSADPECKLKTSLKIIDKEVKRLQQKRMKTSPAPQS